MTSLFRLILSVLLLNCVLTTFAGADVAPEPGEIRGESPTARLRRDMAEACVGKKDGSSCSIWAWSNGVCKLNRAAQDGPTLQCERSEIAIATPSQK